MFPRMRGNLHSEIESKSPSTVAGGNSETGEDLEQRTFDQLIVSDKVKSARDR
jgi:hypothetical protein